MMSHSSATVCHDDIRSVSERLSKPLLRVCQCGLLSIVLLISACSPNQPDETIGSPQSAFTSASETPVPTSTIPIPTETPSPTYTITPSPTITPPLGESGNPITIALAPGSVKLTELDLLGIAAVINEETGANVQLVQTESYADAGQMLCAQEAEAAILDTSTYLYIHAAGCAEAFFISRSNRSNSTNGQILAGSASGVNSLDDMVGHTFCRLSDRDLVSWLIPNAMLCSMGLDPLRDLEAIHDLPDAGEIVQSIYTGQCAAGVVDPEVFQDFQSALEEVKDGVSIIGQTLPIPYENVSFLPNLPEEIQDGLVRAMTYLSFYNGGQTVKQIYGWDNLVRIDDGYYDDIAKLFAKADLGPHGSGLNVAIDMFEEFFDEEEILLQTGDFENGTLYVMENNYAVSTSDGGLWGIFNRQITDSSITVDMVMTTNSQNSPMKAGIGCRVQDNGDQYRFLLNEKGEFAVIRIENQTDRFLQEWTPSVEIHPIGEPNRIKAVCTHNVLRFYINETLVFEGQDDGLISGAINLGISSTDSAAEVFFDNLFIGARK